MTMLVTSRLKPSWRRALAVASTAVVLCLAAPGAWAQSTSELLKHADQIKTTKHAEFLDALKAIDASPQPLSDYEQSYLSYLKAWEAAYAGDYPKAIPQLGSVFETSPDMTLRFRAGVTEVNTLAIAAHYEEAYSRLTQILEMLPKVQDKDARIAANGVAAFLYVSAGQVDLAADYADKLELESQDAATICKGAYLKSEAAFKKGGADADEVFRRGVELCSTANEPLWGNLIRAFVANRELEKNQVGEAVKLLKANYDDVQRTHYARLTSEFDSILARAYWKQGDGVLAHQFAQSAIDKAVKNEITKPLADAYEVLYQIAKQQGDFDNALAYHEKYAAADKGYLNDTSARTLAFQMVNQQVLDKKRQIDALNEKNQRLQLQQQVDSKTAETARLYIALLIVVLAFIGFWAYKTKRSQLRFMRLARRDGLTGIFNRQHFIDAATDQLRYCGKSARDACVIVIDLDHFKSVNDVYGHATGDLVLRRAVKTCEDHLRSIDVFGRLGGEEFGIVLPDCALEQALKCAEGLRQAIAAVSGSDARIEFPVSASFGIAATHTSGYDLRELLANADSALYEAKREGRNRIATYSSSPTVNSIAAATKAASTR